MRILLSIFFCFSSFMLSAQAVPEPDLSKYKTQNEKVRAWVDYCDAVLGTEDYAKLRELGLKGLKLVPKNDYAYHALFTFYIGVAYNTGNKPDSAVYYFSKSEQLARKANNKRRIFLALKQLLYAGNSTTHAKSRQRALDSLLKVMDTARSAEIKADICENLSSYYTDKGEYETGMRYRIIGLTQRRKDLHKASADDSINFGVQLLNIGEIYMSMDQERKALDYLKESEHYVKTYDIAMVTLYKDYCDVYLTLGQRDKALGYYQKLVDYLKPVKEPYCWSVLIGADLVFADKHLEKKEIQQAQHYLQHANSLVPKYANDFTKAEVNYMNGEIQFALKNYAKALEYLNAAEPVLKDSNVNLYAELEQTLSEANAALGNYKEAYRHSEIYAKLQDTLMGEAAKKNLAEMEARYQNKDKQQKIDAQNLEIESAERQRWFFIIGLVLLGGIVASLVVIYRNKQKSARLFEQKNTEMALLNENLEKANATKAKLFSIISHDMRSPISQISQFLDLQKHMPEMFSEEDKQRHNDNISKAAEAVLETMEDLLIWSKAQMQQFSISKENVNLKQVVENINELLEAQLSKKQLKLQVGIDGNLSAVTDKNMLVIIIRNLLQNAMAHSQENSSISISAEKTDGVTQIHIADSGSGMSDEMKAVFNRSEMTVSSDKSGLGLTIVREMADLLKAGIAVSDKIPNGTVFTVSVPDID